MKLTSGLTRHLNIYTSLVLYIQCNQNSPILAEDDNASDYFIDYKEEKYLLGNKKQDVKKNQRDLVGKSLDNESINDILLECTPQDGFLKSGLLSFLREVKLSEQEFFASKPVFDIKYNHLGS